jgi:hypothetical protein
MRLVALDLADDDEAGGEHAHTCPDHYRDVGQALAYCSSGRLELACFVIAVVELVERYPRLVGDGLRRCMRGGCERRV